MTNTAECIEEILQVLYSDPADQPDIELKKLIYERLDPILAKFAKSNGSADGTNAIKPAGETPIAPKTVPVVSSKTGLPKKTPGPKKGSVNIFTVFLSEKADWDAFKSEKKAENADATPTYAQFQQAMKPGYDAAKRDAVLMQQLQGRASEFAEWRIDHPKSAYADFKKVVGPMVL